MTRYFPLFLGVAAALFCATSLRAQPAPSFYPGCVYNVTPPTLANNQTAPWQCDVNGKLITTGSGGGGSVSVTAGTANIVVTPSPLTGTGTVGTTAPIRTQSNTTDTVVAADATKVLITNNGSAIAETLPQAGSAGFGAGFTFMPANVGAGAATYTTTTSTILGGGQTLFVPNGVGAILVSDGTNWPGLIGVPPYPNSTNSFLRGDGTWNSPTAACSGDINTGCSTVTGLNGGTFAAFFASPPAIGGTAPAAVAGTSLTTTGLTSTNTFLLNGNVTAASWTTAGIGFIMAPGAAQPIYTDSSASGTVGVEAINVIGIPKLAASGTATFTRAVTLYIAGGPAAGTGATITNSEALYIPTGKVEIGSGVLQASGGQTFTGTYASSGGTVNINNNSSFGINIGTGTDANLVAIGGGANAVTIAASAGNLTLSNLSTGTNADFLCVDASDHVLLQSSACTISSRRFKEDIQPYATGLDAIMAYEAVTFRLKNGAANPDANAARTQIGLTAENVASVDRRAAIFEPDGITPKSYRQESVIAQLVAAVQSQQREIEILKRARR